MGIKEAIAFVCPDRYYKDKQTLRDFKEKSNKEGYSESVQKMAEKNKSDYSLELGYNSPEAHLESIYFWVLDFLQSLSEDGVEKIVDNFTSAPGSGHFAEMGGRATRMQEEGMKILGSINLVIKSVIQLAYDLKEYEIRLDHYEKAKSKDSREKEAGFLALKQIWMDNVDMKRGRGSIHQMTYELGFTTLREAFLVCNSLEDVDKNEIINEQIKRIVKPRVAEFLSWIDLSEKELRKRFEIEKAYFRQQVETIKLYTSWAKPYIKAAQQLQQKGFDKNPALVAAFNTTLFEIVLFGKAKLNFEKAIYNQKLPKSLQNYKEKRKYYSCLLVSVNFEGFPQKVTQQAYGFGGKVTMNFDSYTLNEDEVELLKKTMEKDDLNAGMAFVDEYSRVALDQLKEDMDRFISAKEEKKEEKNESLNPFSALMDFFKSEEQKEKKKIEKPSDIRKDNYVEKEIRQIAAEEGKKNAYSIYDIYKKAHGMASSPEEFD